MDLSKLTYTKGTSERVPQEAAQKSPAKRGDEEVSLEVPMVSPAYQKLDGVLSSNLVFVLSGGEKKEKDFLRELIRQRELHSLKVAFMSKTGQGLQPYQMQSQWLAIQEVGWFMINGQRYHLDTMDKVFLLSDVDEFYDQLVKIRKGIMAEDRGQWIVSNPCFEIWLYYCYLDNPEDDLGDLKSLSVAKRSKRLKVLGQKVVAGGINPCIAFERMIVGIEHSKVHYYMDENEIPVLFATQMHELAQYIVDTMNENANEYSEFVKRKEDWRKQMRKK